MSSHKEAYRLLEKIGSGGMAEIYRAQTSDAQGRVIPVAVKRLLSHLVCEPEVIRMFVDEARILAGLHHPNIVRLHDFAKVGDEYLLVLEYVHGRSLAELLARYFVDQDQFPPQLAAYIIGEVAAGLAFAHNKTDDNGRSLGIVHRDITPHNILISAEGQVKLTDFGIAWAIHKRSRTRVGFVKGKVGYLAPEQVLEQPVDRRTDLFTLGIVFYRMLAGRPLFLRSSDSDVLENLLAWRGLPPEQCPQNLPTSMVQILQNLLQPRPVDRYQDAESLLTDLRQHEFRMGPDEGGQRLAEMLRELFPEELSDGAEQPLDALRLESVATSPLAITESLIKSPREVTDDLDTHVSNPFAELEHSTISAQIVVPESKPVSVTKRSGLGLPGVKTWIVMLVVLLFIAIPAIWVLWGANPDTAMAEDPRQQPQALQPTSDLEGPSVREQAPPVGPPPAKVVPAPPPVEDPENITVPAEEPAPAEAKQTASSATRTRPRPARRKRRPSSSTVASRPEVVYGTLTLNSEPWARMEIDGKPIEGTTPLVGYRLHVGKHTIRLTNPVVNRQKTIQVQIQPGKQAQRIVRF